MVVLYNNAEILLVNTCTCLNTCIGSRGEYNGEYNVFTEYKREGWEQRTYMVPTASQDEPPDGEHPDSHASRDEPPDGDSVA